MKNKYQVCISSKIHPYPADYEIAAAIIISNYLKGDVEFIKGTQNAKSADFRIKGKIWEVKSPIGDGKRTMQNNLRKANGQSHNIIIDLSRCKMNSSQALSRIRFELGRANDISHLLVIEKSGKVIELK